MIFLLRDFLFLFYVHSFLERPSFWLVSFFLASSHSSVFFVSFYSVGSFALVSFRSFILSFSSFIRSHSDLFLCVLTIVFFVRFFTFVFILSFSLVQCRWQFSYSLFSFHQVFIFFIYTEHLQLRSSFSSSILRYVLFTLFNIQRV